MITRIRSNDFVLHGALVFGGVAAASLFNYLFYMLLGRLIGVESYGVVTSLMSALLVIGAPAIVAQLIAARLAADLKARGDLGALRKLGDVVTMYALGIGAMVVVIGIMFREQIATYFNLGESPAVVVTLIALAIFCVTTVQRGVLQGAHYFGDLAASMSIEAAVKVIAGVTLAAVLGGTGALIGAAVGSACSLLYNQIAFRARFGIERNPVALRRDLIVRVVSGVGIGQLTLTVLMFYDVPLVKHIFDARSAGLYAAAALAGRAVTAAVSFVPTLIMPKVTARAAAGRSALPLLGMALAVSLAIVAMVSLLAALAPRFVVTLLAGRAFGDAAPLVLLYVAASGCLSLATVVAAYKTGLHRYEFVKPSLVVAVTEILVISFWHPSLLAVVGVLATGHAAVLAATLIRITAGQSQGTLDVDEIVPVNVANVEF